MHHPKKRQMEKILVMQSRRQAAPLPWSGHRQRTAVPRPVRRKTNGIAASVLR
jgi:hypothetical protein